MLTPPSGVPLTATTTTTPTRHPPTHPPTHPLPAPYCPALQVQPHQDHQDQLHRHHEHAGAGQALPRPLPHLLHLRGVRRPAGAPPGGWVLRCAVLCLLGVSLRCGMLPRPAAGAPPGGWVGGCCAVPAGRVPCLLGVVLAWFVVRWVDARVRRRCLWWLMAAACRQCRPLRPRLCSSPCPPRPTPCCFPPASPLHTADRVVLGQRQPHRRAQLLRRGQARGGVPDHGLPSRARPGGEGLRCQWCSVVGIALLLLCCAGATASMARRWVDGLVLCSALPVAC